MPVGKRKRVPSVLVDCRACGAPFEVDARTFDLAVETASGWPVTFACPSCRSPRTGARR